MRQNNEQPDGIGFLGKVVILLFFGALLYAYIAEHDLELLGIIQKYPGLIIVVVLVVMFISMYKKTYNAR